VGLVVLAAFVVLAVSAPAANADFGIAEWEALTCRENVDTPLVPGLGGAITGVFPIADDPEQCNSGTPAKWYTQAAGHPPFGTTDFTLNTLSGAGVNGFPDGFVEEIVVDIPEGLGVNPEATPKKCTVAELRTTPAPTCPASSLVGFNYLTVATQAPPCVAPVAGECVNLRAKLPVFNLVSFDGVPSMVGFPTSTPGEPTIIVGDLDPADQHVRFTISDIHAPPGGPPIVGSRLVFNGNFTPGFSENYLTMPSNCAGGQTTNLHVRAHGGAEDSASYTTAVGASGCDSVPFNPDLGTAASGATDSPEPATVDVQMPDQLRPLEPIANSHLLTAKVTLPEGAGLNPSVANGLTPCTDAQFKKGTDDPIACPESSKIGTVEVATPALDQDLGGTVYVGQPTSNNPASGDQFRVFIHAVNDRYGVNVRLVGNVFPNLQTGQLTAVVPNNPQAPFSSFKVHLDGGPRGALTSPPTCGPHTTTAVYTPWSGTADVTRTSQFTLGSAPGGGPCAQTLADRPFNPGYDAGPAGSTAGAFSPFEFHVTRPDGAQELRQINAMLPSGMIARLAGMEYCPEANIAAAANRSGAATIAEPPCPNSSFAGTTGIDAGSGATPYHTDGNVYLAGPYKGAPVSLVFVTPAVAGPYDLGTVVVRTALHIDPETVQVKAVSDTIPDVFGGVKLSIRRIDVSLWRKKFTVNPTTCRSPVFVVSDLFGGGGNPADPAQWFTSTQQSRFQATKCRALRFVPRFFARLTGPTKRAGNPKFRAVYRARKGDSNLRRAAFVLPRATILDQSHIRTVCTRPQLAARNCPKKAIYGHARATSPLLDGVLKGPVYLVSSDDLLPNLLADLRGQVNVRLRGEIIGVKGRLKTVFHSTPDVAVRKFILNMRGGDRGLLINSNNLCDRNRFAFLNLRAHNSRRMKVRGLRLNIPACRNARN
jgi:hypothetical protein